ncbi:tetratricopeptide repeat protein, partial [Myxococcota bacterium]|nr:tetratricopeptide repeat protein [Myxococcota bacterium]
REGTSTREPARDASAKDAGAKDAGAKDASAKDAGAKDASAKDAGAKDASAKDASAKDAPAKDPAKEAAKEAAREAAAKAKAEKAAAAAKSEPSAPAAAEPNKQVGPASTRMVDEALWALLGGKADASPKPVVPIEHDKKPAADKEKAPAKDAKAADEHGKKPAGKAEKGPMVVRTSAQYGSVLGVATMIVVAGAALWIGYAAGLAGAGPPPEVASEEVKGIAADLEKGSLAALLAAEEKVQVVGPSLPALSDLFQATLAEIYARRWQSFGGDRELLAKAREKLASLKEARPTVELLAARVVLSTSAADRAALDAMLVESLSEYPASPKTWVLRARIAAADGRTQAAEDALYTARVINPQHRMTLLELARHHARVGAPAAAFSYFDQLQAAFPEDVEAAIERYVLGQVTGRDPSEGQAAATLAGLVRQELADVAKDEAGRVAIAFGVTRLMRGDLAAGIEELGKAESAYKRSAELRATLGALFLATGEWQRARAHYTSALELEPDVAEHRLGLARAMYGERAGLVADPEKVKKVAQAATNAKKASEDRGSFELPFGTVRFELGRFSLVTVEPRRDVFPEAAYAAATKRASGAALQKALEAASIVALANAKVRAGELDAAVAMLDEARALSDDANVRVALGRASLAKKDRAGAKRHFEKALSLDAENVAARVGTASVLADDGDLVGAIEILEKLDRPDLAVPQALVLLGRLRVARGDYEGALSPLERAVELDGGDVSAALALGEVQHRLKQPDKALETIKRVFKSGKAPERLTPVQAMYLGRLELEKNEKRGLELLEEALAREEDAPDEAHFHLGKFLVKRPKTKKEGRQHLQTFLRLRPAGDLAEEAERLLR